MAYFKVLTNLLADINTLLVREESWLILINADPDALASAFALQRLIRKKVKNVHIARINTISRPDNLAMIRYLRIPVKAWDPKMRDQYDKFAIVDSQPHHSPHFADIPFSLIIDHHPLPKNQPSEKEKSREEFNEKNATRKTNALAPRDIDEETHAHVKEEPIYGSDVDGQVTYIRQNYGATSTMFTELLYNASILPNKHLATALQYGIRTDTGTFGRNCAEVDLRAYHYLSRFADSNLIIRIIRSEYLPHWLAYFSKAFETFRPCGLGHFMFLSNVESSDLLVVIADFFLKVHGLKYIVVTGVHDKKAIAIFRGSNVDLGTLAQLSFDDIGSAGGHKSMARAEIPLVNIRQEKNAPAIDLRRKNLSDDENFLLESFLFNRLKHFGTKKHLHVKSNKGKD